MHVLIWMLYFKAEIIAQLRILHHIGVHSKIQVENEEGPDTVGYLMVDLSKFPYIPTKKRPLDLALACFYVPNALCPLQAKLQDSADFL